MRYYPSDIKILRKKDGREYLQVARNIRLDDGRISTQVIKSFGKLTPENRDRLLMKAKKLERSLNQGYTNPDLPCLKVNPTPRERLRSMLEGPLGLISPETTPLISGALFRAAEIGVTEILTQFGLREAIRVLQPHLGTEVEVEKFYRWIEPLSHEEQVRILVRDWYFPGEGQ